MTTNTEQVSLPAERTAWADYPNFEDLLGRDAWQRLPAAVRDRFATHHAAPAPVSYTGTMERVAATGFGKLLALFARVFNTPVAPYTGDAVEVVVNVYAAPDTAGIVWERVYYFPGRDPVTVRSTKCLDTDGSLLESLGRGLRMKLDVFERDGALHFVSTGYVIDFAGLCLRLPAWFPPGTTHVIHTDEGDGRFRFTLFTRHPWLGEMYYQDGVFGNTEVHT